MRSILALAFLVSIAGAEGTDEALAAEVERFIAAADEPPPKGWVAEVSLGFAMTDGNSDTMTVAFAAKGEREWDK